MELNIKRFASAGNDELYPDYSYDYTPNGYIRTAIATIVCEYNISSVFLVHGGNEIDDTANWIITEDFRGRPCIKRYFHEPVSATYHIYCENNETSFFADVYIANDFQPESEQYPVILNHDVKISDSNTKLKKVAEVVENYFDELYPIGSVYKSTSSSIPFDKGTWSLIKTEPDRNYIGSQVIHTGASGSGTVGKTSLYGAYSYQLIDGVFANTTCPNGYHREYRLTFQGTTGSDTYIYCYINNIQTSGVKTYSASTFRTIGASSYFKESDIVLETTKGYSQKGTNFYYAVTGSSSSWEFKNATIHGYYVSDKTYYYWERTA